MGARFEVAPLSTSTPEPKRRAKGAEAPGKEQFMSQVTGLHHITMLAASAPTVDTFWRGDMGLARVRRTVNSDRPDAYHLLYGDAAGTPGTLITVHPFANLARGVPGVGEIAEPALSLAPGALQEWRPYLMRGGYAVEPPIRWFDRNRNLFDGPDGARLALQIDPQEQRPPRPLPFDGRQGVRGVHSVTLRVRDGGAAGAMLEALGFTERAREDHVVRYTVGEGRGGAGRTVDVAELPDGPPARLGAGSVHHLAFAVADGDALRGTEEALRGGGYEVAGTADRGGYASFHFRGPENLLFEVATEGPGIAVGEAPGTLGERLWLPPALEPRRASIETALEPL